MFDRHRRQFLGVTAGAAAAAVLGGGRPSAGTTGDRSDAAPVEALRLRLLNRQRELHSLAMTLETISYPVDELASVTDDMSWIINGQSEFFFDRGRYRLTHFREGLRIFEIAYPGRYLQAAIREEAGTGLEVLYNGPWAGSRHPALTIGRLIPVLGDAPIYSLGTASLQGVPCHVLGQNKERYYVSQAAEEVLRVDVFVTSTLLRERIYYLESRTLSSVLSLPCRIITERLDGVGNVKRRIDISFGDVAVNQPVSPSVFSF